jgi:hypothetical protein
MFTYTAFIEELRPLIQQANSLLDRPEMRECDEFRKWRHEVMDLISRIELQKYNINCQIAYRKFNELGSYSHSPSKIARMATYNRDIRDTITELQTLVTRFDKYGDPKAEMAANPAFETTQQSAEGLFEKPKIRHQPPEKVTPAWLWEHAPVTLWLQGLGIVGASFLVGVSLGQSAVFAELRERVTSYPVQEISNSSAAPAATKK